MNNVLLNLVHTIINTVHIFKYHRWTDFDTVLGDALALHSQDLCKRNVYTRSKPLSGCSSAGSLAGLPNGSTSSTNSPTGTGKHKVNRKTSPLEIIGKPGVRILVELYHVWIVRESSYYKAPTLHVCVILISPIITEHCWCLSITN